jgi:DNA-directed RNA polymerase specialized sigma24 family protein
MTDVDFDDDTLLDSHRYLSVLFLREGLSAEDAEELTNETLVKVLKRRCDRGSVPCTPDASKALLARIAKRLLCDFLRRRDAWGKPVIAHEGLQRYQREGLLHGR